MKTTIGALCLVLCSCKCGVDDTTKTTEPDIKFNLVEAQGFIKAVTTDADGNCTRQTKSSVRRFSVALKKQTSAAATFSQKYGTLDISAEYVSTQEPIDAIETCGTSVKVCDSNGNNTAFSTFLNINGDDMLPKIEKGSASPQVFFPKLEFPWIPKLCGPSARDFTVPQLLFFSRPVSIAQIRAGRFVIAAKGTSPIEGPERDVKDTAIHEDIIEGTLEWDYSFVFEVADYDKSNPPIATTEFETWNHCPDDIEAWTMDSLNAAGAKFSAGVQVLSLTPRGCRKLVITTAGDVETTLHVTTLGTKYVVDKTTGAVSTLPNDSTGYRIVESPTQRAEFTDYNDDGIDDASEITTFDPNGMWNKSVAEWRTPDGGLYQRITETPTDAIHMRYVNELDEDGTGLKVIEDFEGSQVQHKCFVPRLETTPDPVKCVGTVRSCTAAELKKIDGYFKSALSSGVKCMSDLGFGSFDIKNAPLTMIPRNELNVRCDTNPCNDFGSFNPNRNNGGKHDFIINVGKTGANAEAERRNTVFHEWLHSDKRFSHNDSLVDDATQAKKLAMADRTYACEATCFSPQPSSCSCARCLAPNRSSVPKKVCERCREYSSTCPTRYDPTDAGIKPVSSAVGAYCQRKQMFCDTKVECDTECTILGTPCEPVRATCDESCN